MIQLDKTNRLVYNENASINMKIGEHNDNQRFEDR